MFYAGYIILVLVAAYAMTFGLATLRCAGSIDSVGVDVLIGLTAVIAGVLLAAVAYIYRPE